MLRSQLAETQREATFVLSRQLVHRLYSWNRLLDVGTSFSFFLISEFGMKINKEVVFVLQPDNIFVRISKWIIIFISALLSFFVFKLPVRVKYHLFPFFLRLLLLFRVQSLYFYLLLSITIFFGLALSYCSCLSIASVSCLYLSFSIILLFDFASTHTLHQPYIFYNCSLQIFLHLHIFYKHTRLQKMELFCPLNSVSTSFFANIRNWPWPFKHTFAP